MIYHTGYLPRDRERDDRLNQTAHRMMREALGGRMILVQRRLGPFSYEYHAVPPAKPQSWWPQNAGG